MIYACYGVWHSTLELNAREQQAHASSYQRYDDHLDDDDEGGGGERPYQGWSAPEERGHQQKQEEDTYEGGEQYEHDGEQRGYQSGSRGQSAGKSSGRTNHGFDVDEEEEED